jgi:hypothetical protein
VPVDAGCVAGADVAGGDAVSSGVLVAPGAGVEVETSVLVGWGVLDGAGCSTTTVPAIDAPCTPQM